MVHNFDLFAVQRSTLAHGCRYTDVHTGDDFCFNFQLVLLYLLSLHQLHCNVGPIFVAPIFALALVLEVIFACAYYRSRVGIPR